MTTLETLKAAKELISDPSKWTTGEYARDSSGNGLAGACESSAVCWCAQGAIRKVTGVELDGQPAINALRAANSPHDYTFTIFNDTHTHAQVLAAFDAAIANIERPV